MVKLVHGEEEVELAILRGLRLAVLLSIVLLALESVGAFLSHSLSVTADAVHDVPDILAFAISFTALRSVERGASERFTFGRHRLEVFAALLNAALVLGTGLFFGYEASSTILARTTFAGPVDPIWIVVVALPSLALRAGNIVSLRSIPTRARDLNLRSVVLHLASDLGITSVLLATALILIVRPSLALADPAAALVISGLLVWDSLPLFREGWEVLAETTPRDVKLEAVRAALLDVPSVSEVHDLHVWAVCPTLICMTAHVQVREMSMREGMEVVRQLRDRMAEQFGILHATFEVEAAGGPH